MTTKFNPDDTGFVPVYVRSISIHGDGAVWYSIEVAGSSGHISFSVKEDNLIKTPDDLKNYIIEEGGENEDE